MPPYKRQHFLPASYLRYFSIDQLQCHRKSFVWRIDQHGARKVRVDSQCAANYHYSRSNPQLAEEQFQTMENRYCDCVNTLKLCGGLSPREYGNLLLSMLDLNMRNAAHVNMSGSEGFKTYQTRWQLFLGQHLLEAKNAPVSKEEVAAHIGSFWQLQIVRPAPGHVFVTSDNPSLWFTLTHRPPALHMVSLPLTPEHLALAFDKRFIGFVDKRMSSSELTRLNSDQIANAIEALYCSTELPVDDLILAQQHFATTNPAAQTKFTAEAWVMKLKELPITSEFSFLRYLPPRY